MAERQAKIYSITFVHALSINLNAIILKFHPSVGKCYQLNGKYLRKSIVEPN